MRRYEWLVLLDPELPDDDIQAFTQRYDQLIKNSSGEVIKVEDWGVKKLAYLVEKKDKGRYILFDFVGLPVLIAEMERQLKIAEEVLKFISVKLADSVDLAAFKSSDAQPAAETEAETPEPAPEAAVEAPAAEALETAPEATAQPEASPETVQNVSEKTEGEE
jgi:small subunit ribosomal protein S6